VYIFTQQLHALCNYITLNTSNCDTIFYLQLNKQTDIPVGDTFIKTAKLARKLQYSAPKQEDPIKGWNSLAPLPPASLK